uniref:G_PROTEIN_RECEP_F1_2 domain-containing protein n=1 Tax=Steinernema glaseri TaxID=37863 RepID=A0A1I7Z107_9BILA
MQAHRDHTFHLPTRAKNPRFFRLLRIGLFCACIANFGLFCLFTTVNEINYVHAMRSQLGICGWGSAIFLIIQGAVSAVNLILLVCTITLFLLLRKSTTPETQSRIYCILAYLLGGSFLMATFCTICYFISVYTVLDECFLENATEHLKLRTFGMGIAAVLVNILLLIAAINASAVTAKAADQPRRPFRNVRVIGSGRLTDLPSYDDCCKDEQLPRYSFCVQNTEQSPS